MFRNRRSGTVVVIGLLFAAAAIAFFAQRYREKRAAPVPAERGSGFLHPLGPPPAPAGPPLFERWARLDPAVQKNRDLFARHYVDAMLGHQVFAVPPRGIPPQLARELLLDDDELLLSSGRNLWSREMKHQPGFAGKFCYGHSTYCLKRLFDVTFYVDGRPAVIYDNQYAIERYPSHTTVRYALPEVQIDEHKFITWDDRAVAQYEARSRDGKPHEVTIEVVAPYPPIPMGETPKGYPQLARGRYLGGPLFLYLDAPGFEPVGSLGVHLRRTVTARPADEPRVETAVVAFRYDRSERELPEKPLSASPQAEHSYEYQKWFAENVPFFDCSDPGFKKMWYYRWWIVRFNMVEAAYPDLNGPVFYEGKLGFDNTITFAVPAQVKELTYLRDPGFALSQVRNTYRNRSQNGTIVDPPGSPYWGENYSHWTAMAVAELNRVHPISRDVLAELLPAMAADVRGWLKAYDQDQDALPERFEPRVTGYDLDILSYWYFNGLKLTHTREPPPLERVDFASFVYGNARGVAELAEIAGDAALAAEMSEEADRVRDAALAHLWDDRDAFFYPREARGNQRIPVRELHGFFPFLTGLAPDEPRYTAALAKLVDPAEFWARFPPVITSLAHYREWSWEMDGLTRNIAPHPISMGGRTLLQALRRYERTALNADHFMELMSRYNDLVYPGVLRSDPYWRPNAHEYYSKWEPNASGPRPKPSDISHDFHSMWLSLAVEGAIGLVPRNDDVIELAPLARGWSHFLIDGLRYHGHDLTIVWDAPDGTVHYDGYPEGLSVYGDGKQLAHRQTLDRVLIPPPFE